MLADPMIEHRVTNLEQLMAELIASGKRVDRQQEITQRNLDRLSMEMREFKNEMREFKNEMREFKDEMREFKDEMHEFKDEMSVYKVETRNSIVEMRKQWGELSNRLGTMVEDLVAPSISNILRQFVTCPGNVVEMAVRVRRFHKPTQRIREFDAIAYCGDTLLINETKSRLTPESVNDFAARLSEAHDFFPEHADKRIIGAIASLYVDQSLVMRGERLGLVVLGFGDDVMQVLNSPGFIPSFF